MRTNSWNRSKKWRKMKKINKCRNIVPITLSVQNIFDEICVYNNFVYKLYLFILSIHKIRSAIVQTFCKNMCFHYSVFGVFCKYSKFTFSI